MLVHDKLTGKDYEGEYRKGVALFSNFCHDELWQAGQGPVSDRSLVLAFGDEDSFVRCQEWLIGVQAYVGIQRLVDLPNLNLLVEFNQVGADFESTIFKLRSTYEVPAHIQLALFRDLREAVHILHLWIGLGGIPKNARSMHVFFLQAVAGIPTTGIWDRKSRKALKGLTHERLDQMLGA